MWLSFAFKMITPLQGASGYLHYVAGAISMQVVAGVCDPAHPQAEYLGGKAKLKDFSPIKAGDELVGFPL